MTLDEIRVLLVDDDEDDFVFLQDLLTEVQDRTYLITWKSNYADGLEALRSEIYDVCLLDQRLGEYTGLDLLRAAHNENIGCPIVLLTGFGDRETDIRAMHGGAADYLVKDKVTAPLLERTIRYAIKHALDLEELKKSEESFRTLFNSTFEGIVVHRRGVISDVNLSATQIFGRSRDDLIGMALHKIFREPPKESKSSSQEIKGIRADGSEVHLEVSSREVTLKKEALGLLAIRDLSVRKQLEAQVLQQDRLASLGLLASSLAHEIGTPMGVIRGRAELIAKKRPDDASLQADMSLIVGQIERITRLVHSLLHIARGSKSETVVDVSVADVVRDISNLMAHSLKRSEIDLIVDVPESTLARSEPGPLGQVLLNLIVNSVHAIEEEKKTGRKAGHRIRIGAVSDNEWVRLSIEDTGCGISQKNLNEVFKPFFTTKDIGEGTGLGLVTSYNLMQSWGGNIQLESKERQGTVFTLFLRPSSSSSKNSM